PSTVATRSSSACVALISMRFIVAFLARSNRAERLASRFWTTGSRLRDGCRKAPGSGFLRTLA
ncbi:MAG: hypothetical protein ACREPV_00720, partial [Lysobacter sp.]